MSRHGKQYDDAKQRFDREREYSPSEAVALVNDARLLADSQRARITAHERKVVAAYADAIARAYPEINHVTSPLRAAARARGDADAFNLWAGQAHELAQELPAGEIVRKLGAEARRALRDAGEQFG